MYLIRCSTQPSLLSLVRELAPNAGKEDSELESWSLSRYIQTYRSGPRNPKGFEFWSSGIRRLSTSFNQVKPPIPISSLIQTVHDLFQFPRSHFPICLFVICNLVTSSMYSCWMRFCELFLKLDAAWLRRRSPMMLSILRRRAVSQGGSSYSVHFL